MTGSESKRSKEIWNALNHDPEFLEGMERARQDEEAGRSEPIEKLLGRLQLPSR
jgi:hypothetical protein